jgi:hypothetical protein
MIHDKRELHPTLIVPVGVLWMRGVEKYGETVWYKDHRHGSALAYFATGILFHSCMSGEDPRKLRYDDGLPAEQVQWIKEQVWELVQNYRRPAP